MRLDYCKHWSGIVRVALLVSITIGATIGLSGCSTARRDLTRAYPPEPATVIELRGRLIDLETAVRSAADANGMAIIAIDRWTLAVIFELRTERGQPAELLVVGDQNGENGGHDVVERAEARIGRFGSPAREAEFLESLRDELADMAQLPHIEG